MDARTQPQEDSDMEFERCVAEEREEATSHSLRCKGAVMFEEVSDMEFENFLDDSLDARAVGASLTAQTLSRFNNATSGSFKVHTSDDDVLSLCPSEFLPP